MNRQTRQPMFLHGLESSSKGTKGRFFEKKFPEMLRPDFEGSFEMRMTRLHELVKELSSLVLVGSSYGGLMAAAFAAEHPDRIDEIILLAPALNFDDYVFKDNPIDTKTTIYHGIHDTVCPIDEVRARASQIFSNLTFNAVDDDHMLHSTFSRIPWQTFFV